MPASTVNIELTLLKRMFNLAVKWGYIDANPMQHVEVFRLSEKKRRILTPEEEKKLLAVAPPHLARIILFAIHTGMRCGEILNLRWSDVDLKAGLVTVGKSKTGRVRQIPINPVVRGVLRHCGLNRGKYVFGLKGKRIKHIATAWRSAVKRAGIPHIRFHDLRHAFWYSACAERYPRDLYQTIDGTQPD